MILCNFDKTKGLTMKSSLIASIALMVGLLCTVFVQSVVGDETKGPKPSDYLRSMQRNISHRHEGKVTGESFCWHAASGAEGFTQGYEATGNTAWLDAGMEYYTGLVKLMVKAPDGYSGWIGPFIYDPENLWCDVHVGDAILLNPMLRFAEVVLADPQLTRKYGAVARQFVKIAKKDFVEKWYKRGTWIEDGPFGFYTSWTYYMQPGKTGKWEQLADTSAKSGLSLPFNKNMTAAMVSLRIYRITGEQKYWDIAQRVFLLCKARMQLAGDYYRWNYWEPQGPWDILPEKNTLRHWVGTHAYRDYQAGEVGDIVEAYHSGLVYDQQDIQWLINTNLKVMWNGDIENPKWRNSNNLGPWKDQGKPDASIGYPRYAGTLWGLSEFDATIRKLSEKSLQPGSIKEVYFQNVIAKKAAGFERNLVGDRQVQQPVVVQRVCTDITMAGVMPSVFKRGTSTFILSSVTPARSQMEIALYSADGSKKVATLFDGKSRLGRHGEFRFEWDGVDSQNKQEFVGRYRIRWTAAGGYREYPIEITP